MFLLFSDFLAQVRIEVNFAIKKKSLFTFTKEMTDSMEQRLLIASYEEYPEGETAQISIARSMGLPGIVAKVAAHVS